jgi:uncharacterized protein YebE (UPF0316 family)
VIESFVLSAVLIFVVRVIGIAISTMRLLLMGRAPKTLVSAIAFVEALTFVLTFGRVAQDLNNIPNLMGYCLGFAIGTLVGMMIEERMAAGFATVNIVSMHNSLYIVEAIRKAGFGATRTSGEGASGTVGLVRSVVRRRDAVKVVKIVKDSDPRAFVTVEETRAVTHGFLGYGRS